MSGNKTIKQEGITLIAIVITITIMLILSTISINMIKNYSIIDKANGAEITTDIANIKEATDTYIHQKEAERIKASDYSMPTTGEDLKDLITEVTTSEGLNLGIYKNFNELGITMENGKGGASKDSSWSGSITELEDCFVINLKTDEVLYITEGKVWKQTGETTVDAI